MNDTSPEMEETRLNLLRQMSPARRLGLAAGWSSSLRGMILASLRQEHENADETMLRRLLAERWLGSELAARAYGCMRPHG